MQEIVRHTSTESEINKKLRADIGCYCLYVIRLEHMDICGWMELIQRCCHMKRFLENAKLFFFIYTANVTLKMACWMQTFVCHPCCFHWNTIIESGSLWTSNRRNTVYEWSIWHSNVKDSQQDYISNTDHCQRAARILPFAITWR